MSTQCLMSTIICLQDVLCPQDYVYMITYVHKNIYIKCHVYKKISTRSSSSRPTAECHIEECHIAECHIEECHSNCRMWRCRMSVAECYSHWKDFPVFTGSADSCLHSHIQDIFYALCQCPLNILRYLLCPLSSAMMHSITAFLNRWHFTWSELSLCVFLNHWVSHGSKCPSICFSKWLTFPVVRSVIVLSKSLWRFTWLELY